MPFSLVFSKGIWRYILSIFIFFFMLVRPWTTALQYTFIFLWMKFRLCVFYLCTCHQYFLFCNILYLDNMFLYFMSAGMGETCTGPCGSHYRDIQCSCLHKGGEVTGFLMGPIKYIIAFFLLNYIYSH